MRLNKRYLFGLLVMAMAALLPSQASAATTVTVVASGLDSPRAITFMGSRALVAESGTGGPTCIGPANSPPCVGNTSQISWVNTKTGKHTPLVTGLYSLSLGQETIGVSGLSVRNGRIYAQIGTTSRELPPDIPIAQQQAGHLISVNPRTGKWVDVASVGDADFDWTLQFTPPDPAFFGDPQHGIPPDLSKFNPDAQEHDANPTSVLAVKDGWLVADSGSNTLTKVGKRGKITILHHFQFNNPVPTFPSDSVPTCLAVTGEATWVGTLAGHLYRLDGETATEVVPRDSQGQPLLTHVTGCTAGSNDTLYLVNMFGPGRPFQDPSFFNGSVVQFKPDEGTGSVLADAATYPFLTFPYTPAIGPDGNLYVTSGATCPAGVPAAAGPPCGGGGKVVKITLPSDEEEGQN
jgi:hypothetical protein